MSPLRRLLARGWFVVERRAHGLLGDARQWLLGGLASIDDTATLHLSARIEPFSGDPTSIVVGANTHVLGQLLTTAHGGRIVIGQWGYIGEGSRIWSAEAVVIGDRVLISHGCEIHDWDAHPLDAVARHAQYRHIVEHGHPTHDFGSRAAAIHIGDDAWIGFGATIGKGVTIGKGSVIAARSLVLEDVPPRTLVGGSPARVIRSL
ncbi:MAG: acyltransferase [Polyangia bacterium]